MKLHELKTEFYFFKPDDYGRIFVFIDFGNVRPWAKDIWPEENKFRLTYEIDITKMAEVCSWTNPGRMYFYYGYYPEHPDKDYGHIFNLKHRKSIFRIAKAKRSGFRTKQKEIKFVPAYDEDGKFLKHHPKCNFDVEITMDMLTLVDKYDTAVIWSGDSDFDGLLGYLKTKSKKIVVVCTRNKISHEVEQAADIFIPAETLKNFLLYENNLPIKTLRP
jgi:uncharacterized LabA/DUF88 family protein